MVTFPRGGHSVPRLDGWGIHWTITAKIILLNPTSGIHSRPGVLSAPTLKATTRIGYTQTLRFALSLLHPDKTIVMKQDSATTTQRRHPLSKPHICITIE